MLVGTGGSLGNLMSRARVGICSVIAGTCGLRAALACALVIALVGCGGGGSASPKDAAAGGTGDGGRVGTGGDICIGGSGGGVVGIGGNGTGGDVGVGGTGMGGTSVGGSGMGGTCDGMGGSMCLDYTPPGPPVGMSVDFVAGVNVSTLAGSGVAGTADGTGAGVGLNNPVSVALASNGDLFVAEYDGNQIRRITAAGASTTVMPVGTLNQPFGLGVASDGALYVDTDHDPQGMKTSLTSGTIWRVDATAQTATVVKADMGRPRGVAVLADGRIALSDYRNHRLMVLDPQTSTVTPLAGNGCAGYADGQGTAARFSMPYGIAVLPDGSLVVADYGNQRLRTVKLDGTVGTLAGDGVNGMVDGAAMQARFFSPEDVAVDASGAIYVSDVGNHRIRRLAQGQVQTLAGDGMEGFADGAGNMAEFYGQEGIAVTPDGRTVYVADGTGGAEGMPLPPYHRVRAIAVPAGH